MIVPMVNITKIKPRIGPLRLSVPPRDPARRTETPGRSPVTRTARLRRGPALAARPRPTVSGAARRCHPVEALIHRSKKWPGRTAARAKP
eukprot:118108-Hanusia_phi.AAC.1